MKFNEFYREPVANVLFNTPLSYTELALRTCYESYWGLDFSENKYFSNNPNNNFIHKQPSELTPEEKVIKNEIIKRELADKYLRSFEVNLDLIRDVGFNKNHSSILEHCVFTIYFEMPRNVLQELSRHRLCSPSVKSTRYTLNKGISLWKKYVKTGEMGNFKQWFFDNSGIIDWEIVDMDFNNFCNQLRHLQDVRKVKLTPDIVKNLLPEHWYTSGIYTLNFRELTHMFNLRLSEAAFIPYRRMMELLYYSLPSEIKYIYQDKFDKMVLDVKNKWESEMKEEPNV
jgi:thymidylate synthase (FAD)